MHRLRPLGNLTLPPRPEIAVKEQFERTECALREYQTEDAASPRITSQAAGNLQPRSTALSAVADPLERIATRISADCHAGIHASALNRVTRSQPSRAAGCLLQLQQR